MKRISIIFFVLLSAQLVVAQRDISQNEEPKFKDRIFFGGGLGFGASSNQTAISLSPIMGYMITNNWSTGVGVTYQYIKLKQIDVSTDMWGGNLFTRYNFKQFFAQAEYDYINYEASLFNDESTRDYATRMLIGGGISQPIGARAAINFLAMYDLTYDNTGIYDSPWVLRVFFTF